MDLRELNKHMARLQDVAKKVGAACLRVLQKHYPDDPIYWGTLCPADVVSSAMTDQAKRFDRLLKDFEADMHPNDGI